MIWPADPGMLQDTGIAWSDFVSVLLEIPGEEDQLAHESARCQDW